MEEGEEEEEGEGWGILREALFLTKELLQPGGALGPP